jgi:fibronectin type 3 domain-containing protein
MSAIVSATAPALPTAPVKVAAAPVSTSAVGLTWTVGPSGLPVAGYDIFRGTTSSNLTQLASRGTATTYNDTSLTPGTTYYYAVKETDSGGNLSPMSGIVAVTTLALPSAPASVTGAAVSKAEIGIAWTAAKSGMPLASYRINRGSSPSNLTQLTILSATTLSFTNYSLTPGTMYYYGIQSMDTVGNVSPMSVVVQIATPTN